MKTNLRIIVPVLIVCARFLSPLDAPAAQAQPRLESRLQAAQRPMVLKTPLLAQRISLQPNLRTPNDSR